MIKELIRNNIKNIPGKRFKDKIVIIECDDWGGIRMPSKSVYNTLVKKHIPFDGGHFDTFDTLESAEDLEYLFTLLLEFTDSSGNHAVITPYFNVANPWFEKIRKSGFEEYSYEEFPKTLMRYGRDEKKMVCLLKSGIMDKIFVPEFHGREHLTVPLWLKELQLGNKDVLTGFDFEYTAIRVEHYHPVARGFRAEYFFSDNNQKDFLTSTITDGIRLFEKIFGYRPVSFVPGNGVFHPDFESQIGPEGIRFLNVIPYVPVPDGYGGISTSRNLYTKYNNGPVTKYLRNCLFEPSLPNYSGIHSTLQQIEGAFRWSKPAIISTHRLNFVGSLYPSNREHGLKELQLLLKAILKNWPLVKFLSFRDFIQNFTHIDHFR